MSNKLVFLAVIFLVLVLVFLLGFRPTRIEFGADTCLTSSCLIGEKVRLAVDLAQSGSDTITGIAIKSSALKNSLEVSDPNQLKQGKVILNLEFRDDVRPGEYPVELEFHYSRNVDEFQRIIDGILGKNPGVTTKSQSVKLRYPDIVLKVEKTRDDYNSGSLDIFLSNKEETRSVSCRIQVNTGRDLSLSHPELTRSDSDPLSFVYVSRQDSIASGQNGRCCKDVKMQAGHTEATAKISVFPI